MCGAVLPPSATLAASNAVYDELLRTALTRLKRLDLALATPDADDASRGAVEGAAEGAAEGAEPPQRPRSTRDYADFLALVEVRSSFLCLLSTSFLFAFSSFSSHLYFSCCVAVLKVLTDVLAKRRRRRLVHWLPFFLESTIELARTFPHASGLLKLIEFAIHAADELRLFRPAAAARGAARGAARADDGLVAFSAAQLRGEFSFIYRYILRGSC